MKTEIKDNAIDIIIKDTERLKELTKQYYDSEDQKETEELLNHLSWQRTRVEARLRLLLDLDIITIDEWTIIYRLIRLI